MASNKTILSNGIALIIAVLYTLAAQAHFTATLTPKLATTIEEMTPNSYAAFGGLGLDYTNFKYTMGAFDAVGATLLWMRGTRNVGLATAVLGFSGGLYGQLYSGGDVTQVGALLGLAFVGYLLAPRR